MDSEKVLSCAATLCIARQKLETASPEELSEYRRQWDAAVEKYKKLKEEQKCNTTET